MPELDATFKTGLFERGAQTRGLIARYTSVLGVMKQISAIIPFIGRYHRESVGRMIADMTEYERKLKDVAATLGITVKQMRELTYVSRLTHASQQELIDVYARLNEVRFGARTGSGVAMMEMGRLKRIYELAGGEREFNQALRERVPIVQALARFLAQARAIGPETEAMTLRLYRRMGIQMAPESWAGIAERAGEVGRRQEGLPRETPRQIVGRVTGQRFMRTEELKVPEQTPQFVGGMTTVRVLTGDITVKMAALGEEIRRTFVEIALPSVTLFLGRVNKVLDWLKVVVDWWRRHAETLERTVGIWGDAASIVMKLVAALILMRGVLWTIAQVKPLLIGRSRQFYDILWLIAYVIADVTGITKSWIGQLVLLVPIVIMVTVLVWKLVVAIQALGIIKGIAQIFAGDLVRGLGKVLAVLGAIVGIQYLQARAYNQQKEALKEIGTELDKQSGKMEGMTDKFQGQVRAMEAIARHDIFGDLVQQIINMPERIMPNLLELTQKRTRELRGLFGAPFGAHGGIFMQPQRQIVDIRLAGPNREELGILGFGVAQAPAL